MRRLCIFSLIVLLQIFLVSHADAQVESAQVESAQDESEETQPAISRATAETEATTSLHLNRGIALLDEQEYEAARAELERALQDGPYRYAQVLQLYQNLGIARAYNDDNEGASWAFEHLLAVAPDEILRYTISPKATFVFERVRAEKRTQLAIDMRIACDPVIWLEHPFGVTVTRAADSLDAVAKIAVLYRIKGEAEYQRVDLGAPEVGSSITQSLDAIASQRIQADSDGQQQGSLELAMVAYNAQGWELYRGPTPEAPLEIPVTVEPPGPWYTQWWTWTLLGGAAVSTLTALTLTVVFWPKPNMVPVNFNLQEAQQ